MKLPEGGIIGPCSSWDISPAQEAYMLASSGAAEWNANMLTMKAEHADTSPYVNLDGVTVPRPAFAGGCRYPKNYVAWFNANSDAIVAISLKP